MCKRDKRLNTLSWVKAPKRQSAGLSKALKLVKNWTRLDPIVQRHQKHGIVQGSHPSVFGAGLEVSYIMLYCSVRTWSQREDWDFEKHFYSKFGANVSFTIKRPKKTSCRITCSNRLSDIVQFILMFGLLRQYLSRMFREQHLLCRWQSFRKRSIFCPGNQCNGASIPAGHSK